MSAGRFTVVSVDARQHFLVDLTTPKPERVATLHVPEDRAWCLVAALNDADLATYDKHVDLEGAFR